MNKILLCLIAVFLSATATLAQCPTTASSPKFTAGGNVFQRIASQWNSYFASKADANNGVLCNPTIIPPITPTSVPYSAVGPALIGLGTGGSLSAPRGYYVCAGPCTVQLPLPAVGYEFCVFNDDNVATAITLSPLGGGARFENTARTGYGTAGSGTMVSAGAFGDKVCVVGRDATHYWTVSFSGSWTVN